jgi:hypothetical protein
MKIRSTIERRLLVNWRADPAVVAPLLPPGHRPNLVSGSAVIGICFVRLGGARPSGLPVPGCSSEGAAHRVGVEWDTPHGVERGVYIWRRSTSSRTNRVFGGRVFPGVHERARFRVAHTPGHLAIEMQGADEARAEVELDRGFESAVFPTFAEASRFFEDAPLGISPRRAGGLEGIRLATGRWSIEPARLVGASSSFYDDIRQFPRGSVELDSALLMQEIPAIWSPAPVSATT